MEHEVINKQTRYINLNGNHILKFNGNYVKSEAQQKNHWSNYWKTKTMFNDYA